MWEIVNEEGRKMLTEKGGGRDQMKEKGKKKDKQSSVRERGMLQHN